MPSNEFTTLNKKVRRGGAYYISYYNLRLWLESYFPGYSFAVNVDMSDNTIAVSISRALPDDDIGKREIHVACAKIPIEFIADNDDYKIKQVIQDAINRGGNIMEDIPKITIETKDEELTEKVLKDIKVIKEQCDDNTMYIIDNTKTKHESVMTALKLILVVVLMFSMTINIFLLIALCYSLGVFG